jgi:hypothetical protein
VYLTALVYLEFWGYVLSRGLKIRKNFEAPIHQPPALPSSRRFRSFVLELGILSRSGSVSLLYMGLNELAAFRSSQIPLVLERPLSGLPASLSNELPTIYMYNRNQTCHPESLFMHWSMNWRDAVYEILNCPPFVCALNLQMIALNCPSWKSFWKIQAHPLLWLHTLFFRTIFHR